MKKLFGPLPTRYARALFKAACAGDVVQEVEQDLLGIEGALSEHGEFAAFLLNPGLSDEKRRGLLESLASRLNCHPVTRRFLDLLLDKRRLELLTAIPAYYHRLFMEHQGEVEVTVTTAIDPSDSLRERIHDHLRDRSGTNPRITWRTDAAILGGLVVEWPDKIMDSSLSRRLSELKESMVAAV